MTRLLTTAALALGLTLSAAVPALASTSSTQCAQAKAAVARLYQLSDYYKTTNPALSKAYLSMARSEESALSYYC